MTSNREQKVPWERIGRPLSDLLRYERRHGRYEHASYELLSALMHGSNAPSWRRFLLDGDHFGVVADQVIALASRDGTDAAAALDSTRQLVDAAYRRDPAEAEGFLDAYLRGRADLPVDVRNRADGLAKDGEQATALAVSALASEIRCLRAEGRLDGRADATFDYWYEEVLRGRVGADRARAVPGEVAAARERLLSHAEQIDQRYGSWLVVNECPIDEESVYERYSTVFTAKDIPGAADLVIRAQGLKLHIKVEQVRPFLRELSNEEAMRRIERLAQWMAVVNGQNHDGVLITPFLASYLAGPGDFESLLGEVDKLRAETRAGRFDVHNELQRDLEFNRFATEDSWVNGDYARGAEEQYAMFAELRELPPPRDEPCHLSDEHRAEADRAAYEAAGLLHFLREFRAGTTRHIMVVGNDRYGRQWIVEPLEDYLKDGFTLRSDRAPSHMSMRMTVRHLLKHGPIRLGFPREFVREINAHMPHVVIVDSCNPMHSDVMMRTSRGARDHANWFMAFNDLRSEGDGSRYEGDGSLPPNMLPELRKWHEYVTVKRQIRPWVTPGPTYKIAHWAPILKDYVRQGDYPVRRRDPDIGSDEPQLILANATVYRSEGDDLPEALQGTHPYYFDGPEKHVKAELLFGFGAHGFETRLVGPTTDQFIEEVQRHITAGVERLLRDGFVPLLASG